MKSNHAKTGLIISLVGLAQIIAFLLVSAVALFFSPIIMCGSTLFSIPLSIGAIVYGWKGREENPRMALAAILIGLSLVPISLFFANYFGDLIYKATA